MTKLSVNVNKIATIRNSRGKNKPDVLQVALDIVKFGAFGITVHPRPDGRHIKVKDVYDLKKSLNVELNVEGYPSTDFLKMIHEVKPAQTTLVPDPPDALTSNAGWKVTPHQKFLQSAIDTLKKSGTRVSVFVEPGQITFDELKTLKTMGCDRVELYTESFADAFAKNRIKEVLPLYRELADNALNVGLKLNAGHDLDQKNLSTLLNCIPEIQEVSIGHALVCEALYQGLKTTIHNYLKIISEVGS